MNWFLRLLGRCVSRQSVEAFASKGSGALSEDKINRKEESPKRGEFNIKLSYDQQSVFPIKIIASKVPSTITINTSELKTLAPLITLSQLQREARQVGIVP